MDNEDIILTPGQKLACYIVAGAAMAALGLFLLLCGVVDAIPFGAAQAIIPAGLVAAGLVFAAAGFIQKNVVSLWVGVALLAAASVSILAPATGRGYSGLYPIYIAAPGIACVATMFYSREYKDHLKAILLFFGLAGLFFLNSLGSVGWHIVLPIMLVSAGIVVVAVALAIRYGVKKELGSEE